MGLHTQLLGTVVDLHVDWLGVGAVGVRISNLSSVLVVKLVSRRSGSKAGQGSSDESGEMHLDSVTFYMIDKVYVCTRRE